MKKIIILFLSLFFSLPSHSNPMNEGMEYKCTTFAIHRIDGGKIDEITVATNTKPFYIALINNILSARFKIMNAPEVADNNARLTKISIDEDEGRQFDTATFIKTRKDGVSTVKVFKELNISDQSVMLASFSEYTGMSAMLRILSRCRVE